MYTHTLTNFVYMCVCVLCVYLRWVSSHHLFLRRLHLVGCNGLLAKLLLWGKSSILHTAKPIFDVPSCTEQQNHLGMRIWLHLLCLVMIYCNFQRSREWTSAVNYNTLANKVFVTIPLFIFKCFNFGYKLKLGMSVFCFKCCL